GQDSLDQCGGGAGLRYRSHRDRCSFPALVMLIGSIRSGFLVGWLLLAFGSAFGSARSRFSVVVRCRPPDLHPTVLVKLKEQQSAAVGPGQDVAAEAADV